MNESQQRIHQKYDTDDTADEDTDDDEVDRIFSADSLRVYVHLNFSLPNMFSRNKNRKEKKRKKNKKEKKKKHSIDDTELVLWKKQQKQRNCRSSSIGRTKKDTEEKLDSVMNNTIHTLSRIAHIRTGINGACTVSPPSPSSSSTASTLSLSGTMHNDIPQSQPQQSEKGEGEQKVVLLSGTFKMKNKSKSTIESVEERSSKSKTQNNSSSSSRKIDSRTKTKTSNKSNKKQTKNLSSSSLSLTNRSSKIRKKIKEIKLCSNDEDITASSSRLTTQITTIANIKKGRQ